MPERAETGAVRASPWPEIDIRIEAPGWSALADAEAIARRAVEAVLADYAPDERGAVAVLLTGDAEIRALNRDFRRMDKPTNVLSFPAAGRPGENAPGESILGDIALAYETCAREAEEEEKPIADHLAHLVVHGTLHLLGFDHETPDEAEEMEAEEVEILARLGIADPYAGTEPAANPREASS